MYAHVQYTGQSFKRRGQTGAPIKPKINRVPTHDLQNEFPKFQVRKLSDSPAIVSTDRPDKTSTTIPIGAELLKMKLATKSRTARNQQKSVQNEQQIE